MRGLKTHLEETISPIMQVPVLKISSATNTSRIGRRRPMFTSFPTVVHHQVQDVHRESKAD